MREEQEKLLGELEKMSRRFSDWAERLDEGPAGSTKPEAETPDE